MTGAYLVAALIIFSLMYAVQLYYNKSLFLKLVNITVIVFISSAVYFTFETYKGWPTIEPIRERSRVYAVIITPPVEGVHKGGIYYLAKEKNKKEPTILEKVFRYMSPLPNSPRIYYTEYTEQEERLFSRVQEALEQGNVVYINPPKKDAKNTSQEKGGKGGGTGSGNNDGTDKKKADQNGEKEPDDYDADSIEIISPDQFLPPKEGEEQ